MEEKTILNSSKKEVVMKKMLKKGIDIGEVLLYAAFAVVCIYCVLIGLQVLAAL